MAGGRRPSEIRLVPVRREEKALTGRVVNREKREGKKKERKNASGVARKDK